MKLFPCFISHVTTISNHGISQTTNHQCYRVQTALHKRRNTETKLVNQAINLEFEVPQSIYKHVSCISLINIHMNMYHVNTQQRKQEMVTSTVKHQISLFTAALNNAILQLLQHAAN